MGSVLNFYGGRANPSYSNFSNYNVYNGSSWLYDFFDILVLDTTWIENDNTYQKIKPSPLTGEPLVYREKFGKVGESTIVTTIKRRYEASWIINTKIVYDNQMSPSQPRTPDNKRPLFPYHVYIGEEESMTLRCVPAYDTFQITWLKFQIKLQELHNELFMVDMTVVDRFCKSGDFEGALKFITKLKETGIGFYRSLPPRGQYTGGNVKPVEKIPSTMMTVIDESIALFDESFKLIQQITGVNAAFMGQQPQTREAEGNVQTALNATMNILKPLVQGIMQVKEESAEFLSEAIRLAVRNDEKAYATYSRITKDIDFLKKSTFTSTQLGIKLIPRPTQQEMAQLQQEINQLAMPGKNGTPLLTAPIMMRVKEMISRGANINKIRIYVTDAVAKEQKRQEDIQKQNIQQQNDGNLKLKQEDNAGEIAKEKAKSDAKLREIQAETEGKLKVNWQQQSHERQMAQMEQDKQQSQPQPQVAMNQ